MKSEGCCGSNLRIEDYAMTEVVNLNNATKEIERQKNPKAKSMSALVLVVNN